MTAPEIAERLDAKRNSSGWQAKCPAHDDHTPSLSISEGSDGRTLLHCHGGCSTESVLAAMGLNQSDLFRDSVARVPAKTAKPAPLGRVVAEYIYRDAYGYELFKVVRYHPKGFRQFRFESGKWVPGLGDVEPVLFRLPETVQAVFDGRTVFCCEGEKDVLAMIDAGLDATCNPMGAGKWRDSFSASLKRAQVVVIADRDAPGRKHAEQVANSLRGSAQSVRVIELPDRNGRTVKDPADFLAAGGTAQEIQAIADQAEPWAMPQPLIARPLSQFQRHTESDPAELLKDRYLCRFGGLLLCGPSGIGKSSFVLQCLLLWSLGREAFGINPARPIRSLVIQGENDDGDIAEMRDGVISGLGLSPAEQSKAEESVVLFREDSHTGEAFFSSVVRPLLDYHKPDLLVIDPAFSYLGGDASSQEVVSRFLRNQLNPLLREFNCGVVIVHHTNKPKSGREKPEWQAGDFAYLGAGSAEWANWPRAVLSLQSIGSHDVYALHAAKRGARLRWEDDEGQTYKRHISHAKEPGVICWTEADPCDLPESKSGRPRKDCTPQKLALLLESKPLSAKEWQALAGDEEGIRGTTFHRLRREAEGLGLVKRISGKWNYLL